jgi:hypothetical protein
MDWLAERRIPARFVLGPALGYPSELKKDTAKALTAMSEHGLRAPVLFYWSGQSCTVVAGLLKKALRLNKLAGVGILPHFLSPRFDCKTIPIDAALKKFAEVLAFLYADRQLSEFLEEPVSDIEERLTDSPRARCVRALVTESGGLLAFRRFPFAAGGRLSKKSQFKVAMCGRCGRCAWKHICGGIDRSPAEFRRQHRIIADAWCLHQKILMRRVIGECLEIREQLSRIKDNLLKDAG